MPHIALMSLALHGHVHPMLGLAAELARRGHEVTFASGEEFADLISATGARPVGYPSVLRSTRTGEGRWMTAADLGARAVELFAAERDAALGPLAAAYERTGHPDAVVYDQVTAVAPVLAGRWGVPRVQFSPTHVLSVAQPSHGGVPAAGDPCVVALPELFQFPFPDLPTATTYVGPLDWQREDPASVPAGAGRVVLVSLGTTFNDRTDVVRAVASAVREECPEHEVVVALGRPLGAADGAGWPPHVRPEPWVAQQAVLRDADVFVTAGGTGSVLEAVRSRTPLVVLPQAPEQVLNARQVVSHGLGTACTNPRPTSRDLREAIGRATRLRGYDEAVERMNRAIDEAGGAPRAADVVEAELRRRGTG